MTHTYTITGMTCGKCVGRVKSELLKLGDVTGAEVQLASPQATISMQRHIHLPALQEAVRRAGAYDIGEAEAPRHSSVAIDEAAPGNYKPIFILGAFLIAVTLLPQFQGGGFQLGKWMTDFMAAFFLSFSFFKLLDLKGFAEAYSTYDVVARRWYGWGYVYPFVELVLGLLFLSGADGLLVNGITFAVMSLSLIGVVQSVLQKRRIRCACLGAVFNLPMSSITVVEDALMVAMSAYMILAMI